MFTAISLFSGAVDGLAIAAQAAGFKVTHHIEWDAWCCRVLRMNHPDSIVLNKDIHDVTGLPTASIVFGGSPCQGWSNAGKQKGFEDPRYLWPQMLRIVRECQPNAVVHENVRGGVSEGLLDQICGDLEGEGYSTKALVFPACVFGAPHERYRFFVIGIMAHTDTLGRNGSEGEQEPNNDLNRFDKASEQNRRTEFHETESSGEVLGNPEINRLETHDSKPIGSSSRLDNGKFDATTGDSASQHNENFGTSADITQFQSQFIRSNRGSGEHTINHSPQFRQLPNERWALLQSSVGMSAFGTTASLPRLDAIKHFPGFPAGQGFYQYPYEPPRTVAKKEPYAKEQIQALGNAVLWQQAAPIMRAVYRWLVEKEA